MQLFLVFFGAACSAPSRPLAAAAVALTLNARGLPRRYLARLLQAVPRGQWEAARALGLRHSARACARDPAAGGSIAMPPTVGYLVQLIKGTSLAAIIGFVELTRAGQIINNVTFRPFLVFGIVAASTSFCAGRCRC